MKRLTILFIIACCVLLALGVFVSYDRGLTEGQCRSLAFNEQSLDTSYHLGYTKGFQEALEGQRCCDLCVVYPERQVILDFLVTDKTNEILYAKDFICADFCDVLMENAWKQGIPCWLVAIEFAEAGITHALVAFPVCENGKVVDLYIEPQNDGEVKDVEVGKKPINCTPDFCETCPFEITKILVFR